MYSEKTALPTMPEYEYDVTLPRASSEVTHAILVWRYYECFGDGSLGVTEPDTVNGWEVLIYPPIITRFSAGGTTSNVIMITEFNSYIDVPDQVEGTNQYIRGAVNGGYDQHAQYYRTKMLALDTLGETKLVVSGVYPRAGYFSLAVYYLNPLGDTFLVSQAEYRDYNFTPKTGALNPYINGNPSVFSYIPPSINFKNKYTPTGKELQKSNNKENNPPNEIVIRNSGGYVYFFRMDQKTSHSAWSEDIDTNGCSRAYLYATQPSEYNFLILRIKVPKTFINSSEPDIIFSEYETRQISIGSHVAEDNIPQPQLEYWTVNSRMLEEHKDENGYAYVFFAPNDYVNKLHIEQGSPRRHPPVMTWGKYTGYVLGQSTYHIIIRYREPMNSWQGSPYNEVCYIDQASSRPINPVRLGKFCPEMYGDTEENFMLGRIGAVDKNGNWPQHALFPPSIPEASLASGQVIISLPHTYHVPAWADMSVGDRVVAYLVGTSTGLITQYEREIFTISTEDLVFDIEKDTLLPNADSTIKLYYELTRASNTDIEVSPSVTYVVTH